MSALREDEMNMVAGGYYDEAAFDSEALHLKGFMDEKFSSLEMLFHWPTDSAKVKAGWAKAGITCDPCLFTWNKYYKGNKKISQRTAIHLIGII